MKKKIFFFLNLLIGFLGHTQIVVHFKYDEAGNQRYRGPDSNAKQSTSILNTNIDKEEDGADYSKDDLLIKHETNIAAINAKDFWNEIKIYPVPVKDILTLSWSDKIDGLISKVSLYEHNTIHWVFQRENLPNVNNKIEINMTGKYAGVYILTFTLTDGRRISKNIIKL